MKKVLASIAFGSCLVLAAPLLAARADAPAAKDKPAAKTADDEQAAWIQKLDEAAGRIESAQKQVEQLLAAKGRGAARRYPRGDAKEKYLKDLDEARKELADAKRSLPVLLDEARRAGVPNGILDRYESLAIESSAAADDEDAADAESQDEGYAAPADKSSAGKKDRSYAAPKDDSAPPAKNDEGEEEPE